MARPHPELAEGRDRALNRWGQPWRIATAAILLAGTGLMLALNAPGQLSWDSVSQLADGRSGAYNSWHPPVMAFLLGLFDSVLPGTGLYLVFQAALVLAALLALVWLAPRPGPLTAAAALILIAMPQWLLYQGEIWKDVLFANAALAGFAALAAAEQHWQRRWIASAAVLLTLAAATRQNGLVLLPVAGLATGLIARRQNRSAWRWGLGFFAATLLMAGTLTLALAARGDGGEGARAQIRLAQAYDLAGALARQPDLPLPLTAADPALDQVLRHRGAALYTPLRNDPFAADPAISAALSDARPGALGQSWRALIQHHPLLYLRVRGAVFAAVLTTPDPQACHFAPVGVGGDPGQMRALGLAPHIRAQDWALAGYARLFFHTPVFAHLAWGAAALILLVLMAKRGEIAMTALLGGALLFAITFVIVSIACDYRYLFPLDLAAMAAALRASGGFARSG